jgi:hypothetical protein
VWVLKLGSSFFKPCALFHFLWPSNFKRSVLELALPIAKHRRELNINQAHRKLCFQSRPNMARLYSSADMNFLPCLMHVLLSSVFLKRGLGLGAKDRV